VRPTAVAARSPVRRVREDGTSLPETLSIGARHSQEVKGSALGQARRSVPHPPTSLSARPGPRPGRRRRDHGPRRALPQPPQDDFDARVARRLLLLTGVVEFERLRRGEPVLLAVVALQRPPDRPDGGPAARVAMRRQDGGVALAGRARPDDPQAGRARHVRDEVGDDVTALQVHPRRRLLHVPDARGGALHGTLAMAQVGARAARPEAAAKEPVLMQAQEPPGVAVIRLSSGDGPGLPGARRHDLEAAPLENLVGGDPGDARGLQRDGPHTAAPEPVCQPVQGGGAGRQCTCRRRAPARGRDRGRPPPCASSRRCRSPPRPGERA
jgi:hypothetical protein